MKKFFPWFIAIIIMLCIAPALLQALMPSLVNVFVAFILPVGTVVILILVLLRFKKKKPQWPTEVHHYYHDDRNPWR